MESEKIETIYRPPEAELLSPNEQRERDSGVFSVLLQSWKIFRQHFLLIMGIYVLVWVVPNQLTAYLDATLFNSGNMFHDLKGSINFWHLVNSFVGIIAAGAIIHVTLSHLQGQRNIKMLPAFMASFKAWGSIWLARFLGGSMLMAGFILPGIVYVLFRSGLINLEMPWLVTSGCLFGGLLVLAYLLYVYLRLMFSMTFVMQKQLSGFEACQASWNLSKRRFWMLLRHFLILTVIRIGPALLIFLPMLLFFEDSLENPVTTGLLDTIAGIGDAFSFVYVAILLDSLLRCDPWDGGIE